MWMPGEETMEVFEGGNWVEKPDPCVDTDSCGTCIIPPDCSIADNKKSCINHPDVCVWVKGRSKLWKSARKECPRARGEKECLSVEHPCAWWPDPIPRKNKDGEYTGKFFPQCYFQGMGVNGYSTTVEDAEYAAIKAKGQSKAATGGTMQPDHCEKIASAGPEPYLIKGDPEWDGKLAGYRGWPYPPTDEAGEILPETEWETTDPEGAWGMYKLARLRCLELEPYGCHWAVSQRGVTCLMSQRGYCADDTECRAHEKMKDCNLQSHCRWDDGICQPKSRYVVQDPCFDFKARKQCKSREAKEYNCKWNKERRSCSNPFIGNTCAEVTSKKYCTQPCQWDRLTKSCLSGGNGLTHSGMGVIKEAVGGNKCTAKNSPTGCFGDYTCDECCSGQIQNPQGPSCWTDKFTPVRCCRDPSVFVVEEERCNSLSQQGKILCSLLKCRWTKKDDQCHSFDFRFTVELEELQSELEG